MDAYDVVDIFDLKTGLTVPYLGQRIQEFLCNLLLK